MSIFIEIIEECMYIQINDFELCMIIARHSYACNHLVHRRGFFVCLALLKFNIRHLLGIMSHGVSRPSFQH